MFAELATWPMYLLIPAFLWYVWRYQKKEHAKRTRSTAQEREQRR